MTAPGDTSRQAMAAGTTATPEPSNGATNLKHRHANGQQSSFADLPSNRRSSTFSSRSSRTDSTTDRRPFSARSSSVDLLSPRATGEEEEHHHETTTFWHSLPILFAIVPALGGIYSKDGSVFVTDLALLLLAGLYLNWCLVTPWYNRLHDILSNLLTPMLGHGTTQPNLA
jgi:hypothetical protein